MTLRGVKFAKRSPEREVSHLSLFRPMILYRERLVCALCLRPFSLALPRWGQTPKVLVLADPSATEIRWTLSGNTHMTNGTFRLMGGLVSFDPATGAAVGEMLVDLSTGESGEKSRDSKMATRGPGIEQISRSLFPSGEDYRDAETGWWCIGHFEMSRAFSIFMGRTIPNEG